MLLCLLAARLSGCGAEPAPIRLTPLHGDAATVETSKPAPESRVSIRTPSGAAVPAALPSAEPTPMPGESPVRLYILNTNTKRFHLPDCKSVGEMKPHNQHEVTATRDELLAQNYIPCGRCKP